MTDISHLRQLAEKWLNGTLSEEEKFVFESWYNQQPEELEWTGDASDEVVKQRILQAIQTRIAEQAPVIELPRTNRFTRNRVAVAAAILFVLGTGAWFFFSTNQPAPSRATTTAPVEVAPGSNKAVLTLADGRQVILEEANGNVAEQGSVTVMNFDGQLAYSGQSNEVLYNTITVPRKGQYQLVLADGTKVWLDAESSLRYPISFPGNQRTVELTGQGYFEVAKSQNKPFHVKTATQDIEVLGTHFNINSYGNEDAVKTTLLEGLVKLTAAGKVQLLAPGQEAHLAPTGTYQLIKNADVEQAMAWKNGQFNFKSASLRAIMNQLVRWYDVDVVYEGTQSIHLSGYVDRNVPLSATLQLLTLNGVRLRQEGKTIVMLP